jgi:hypothetical protein
MSDYIGSALGSANTRAAKVRTFLAKPPKRAAFLRLVAAGDEAEAQVPLGEWQREEVLPELALEILAKLDEHATEMQAHITANLSYVDNGGKVVNTLLLKRQGNHVQGEGTSLDTPEGINSQLTGDVRAQSIQAQRHNEVMFRVYMTGMASILTHSERIVARQAEMLESMASRLGRAERQLDGKEAELQQMLEAMAEAKESGEAMSPAMQRAFAMLEALAPHLMAQLMSGRSSAPSAASEP